MKEIIINSDKYGKQIVFIDDEDYEIISQQLWFCHKGHSSLYAMRADQIGEKRKHVKMHRKIMGLKTGDPFVIDHIDHNGLNNQKSNLRIVKSGQNSTNRRKQIGSTSIYKGVYKNKGYSKWLATICNEGKDYYLGSFETEIEAALAYDKKSLELHGEYGLRNFK